MGRRQTQDILDLKQRFAGNLILLRSRVDLSQEETAERAGLHKTELSLLERGLRLPRLDTLVKLSGAIEIEPCALLTGMTWRLGSNAGQPGTYMQQGTFPAETPRLPESP